MRKCETAPVSADFDSESKCEAYLPGSNCTTKKGGGCVVKSTCSAATAESACNNVVGKPDDKCTWEKDNGKCRD